MKKRKSQSRSSQLGAKQTNADASDLDLKSSFEIAHIINAEDAKVAAAVKTALPQIGKAIDLIADAIAQGGRLIYVGAGTSGRIAALDAAECPPTFNVAPETVQFVMAGGPKALATAVEANEDSRRLGEREITKRKLQKHDVVVGIAASGRTPFTVAALEYARRRGAKTIAVTCKRNSPLEKAADLAIVAELSRQPGSCSAGHAGCERKPSRGGKSAETSQRACEAGNCPSCFQETLVILVVFN